MRWWIGVMAVLAFGCGEDAIVPSTAESGDTHADPTATTSGPGLGETGPGDGLDPPDSEAPDACKADGLAWVDPWDCYEHTSDHGPSCWTGLGHLASPTCDSVSSGPRLLGYDRGLAACGCDDPRVMQARDLDGDGADELIVGCGWVDRVVIWRGRSDGQLACAEAHAVFGTPGTLWWRDLDEDGVEELVTLGQEDLQASVLPVIGPGQLGLYEPIAALAPGTHHWRGVELDVDGLPGTEIALVDNATSTVQFVAVDAGQLVVSVAETPEARILTAVDLDGDGWDDLVATPAWQSEQPWWWARGSANGLEPAHALDSIASSSADLGDVDGDGLVDAVLSGGDAPRIQRGLGDGLFAAPEQVRDPNASAWTGGQPQMVRDLDGDGRAEIVLSWAERDSGWNLWRSTPAGPRFDFHAGLYETVLFAAGDFDGDGHLDLVSTTVVSGETLGQITIWRAGP